MEKKFDITLIKAVIGLGNPGNQYYKNRHNIGFRVLDELAAQYGASWKEADKMLYATIIHHDQPLLLIKPMTFMNDSGRVLPWLQKKGIKADQIVVVHDELEKKFGQVVMSFGGSHKGHNGLKSIIGMIGPDFWRIKVGIARPADRDEVSDYVLSNFPPDQEAQIPSIIAACIAHFLPN